MSKDNFILHEWEKEKMDRLLEISKLEAATKEGLEQGIQQGIEEGIEQGIEQNKKDIVINMYNKKYSLEEISDITNLNMEKIKKIIEEI